ncbi:DUF6289 family protein [Micromonospora haikouensis]|uniref:DUF6289 family protein n=1 Tax=Micromonospora haikouensis TaxID=686309 RepID=UPI0037BE0753
MRRSRRRIAQLAAVAMVAGLGLIGTVAPAQAKGMIVFVSYYSDATYTNHVGGSTFSDCPGDPSYHWGSYTPYYLIEEEPCP